MALVVPHLATWREVALWISHLTPEEMAEPATFIIGGDDSRYYSVHGADVINIMGAYETSVLTLRVA